MQHNDFLFSRDVYLKELKLIRDIHFTSREVDVMFCILHVRGARKIASLLSIALNTVSTHTNNIKSKLGCHSREGIIDFIEKSDKFQLLRDYYVNLLLEAEFIKALKAISKLKNKNYPSLLFVAWESEANKDFIIQNMEHHLKCAGINAEIREQITEEDKARPLQRPNHSLIIFLDAISDPENYSGPLVFIDTRKQNGYYLLVFEILQELVEESKLESIFNNFLQYYNERSQLLRATDLPIYSKKEEQKNKEMFVVNYKKFPYILITCFLCVV